MNRDGVELIEVSGPVHYESLNSKKMERVREVCEKLDALVILEGTQSMTDCVKLAEYFLQRKSKCRIVGVPSLCRTTRRLKQVWDLIQFQDVMLILSKIWKLFVNPR